MQENTSIGGIPREKGGFVPLGFRPNRKIWLEFPLSAVIFDR
jgi:hypothetical protein